MFGKAFKVTLLTFLIYLLQATVSEHISLWDVGPNIALALISVITVALGRKYAFLSALTVGYLLEVMIPMLDYINLILYPVAAMLGALVFSDKSERKLEEEITMGRYKPQWNPHLRTPLCAMLSVTIYEGVNLLYIYLSGVQLDAGHIRRTLIDVGYSTVIAGVFQFPIRWWLGVYKLKRAR